MRPLTDSEITGLVVDAATNATNYISGDQSRLSRNRETLLDYYNQREYGDEKEGQSKIVTSDVADVVEWMLPSLLRIFTQGKYVGIFEADFADGEDEARQKTAITNHEFMRRNKGVFLLHNMIKDALLQYTGVMKITWDSTPRASAEIYRGLSQQELDKLKLNEEYTITFYEEREIEVEQPNAFGGVETVTQTVFDIDIEIIDRSGRVKYELIPPEEFLINSDARDFEHPKFIGNRTPRTRTELLIEGYDPDVVNSLPADEPYDLSPEKQARNNDIQTVGPTSKHHPNDTIFVGEYYMQLDVDGDGVSEDWQFIVGGNRLLAKKRVHDHPYAILVPVPIPHRAIGSCPAEQTADIQYWKSTLVRQMNNNIYQTNYGRHLINRRVNADQALNPVAGGVIQVDDKLPVDGAMSPIQVTNQVDPILRGIEYADTAREVRTGVTRYNQGLDAQSLNKTATGFIGIKEASEQRMEMIARIFADTGIKDIFKKTAKLISMYQRTSYEIRVSGQPLEVDPRAWRYDLDCYVNVGLGTGDRLEKIRNLSAVLDLQKEAIQLGSSLTDESKIYNTLAQLVHEVGLKEVANYFNDPKQPDELLQRENELLRQQLQQMTAAIQNPLAETEAVRGQYRLQETMAKEQAETERMLIKEQNQQDKNTTDQVIKLTELELKYDQDVPGSAV